MLKIFNNVRIMLTYRINGAAHTIKSTLLSWSYMPIMFFPGMIRFSQTDFSHGPTAANSV
ncbi:MAG: hypothetical protein CVV49_18485 [Spirochaetae bacterium HGW-Spirochaetae-5]|nr:MAG: hypothetical protein CVV49_18485 [Spirochaetae bacterium HGW-Spirochaetae-5]